MPNIQAESVKKLRQKTSAGIMDCKQALQASQWDFNKALDWLRKKGLSTAEKKAGRKTGEGLVASYIHGNGRLGVLLEVNSETDFVARNQKFQSFVKDLSLHIAAMNPLYIKEEDIEDSTREKEKKICEEQAGEKSKDEKIRYRIAEGLYKQWLKEVCLFKQEFVHPESESKQTVEQALKEIISLLGENICIRRFARFALGSEENKNALQPKITIKAKG